MKKTICYILFSISFSLSIDGEELSNDTLQLDVLQAIRIARTQSPDVLVARHSFRSSYWNYCYYKANFKPTLSFSSIPYYNNQINIVTMEDGTSKYIRQKQLRTDGNLSITQNIPWTGGSISVNTSLQRLDILGSQKYHTYKTNPVNIILQQSVFGYNSLKWDRKIEPLRFEEAKKEYVETLELVSVNTVTKFFNLARSQSNLEIAHVNFANADTLYTFAKGRYNIGTITENEMLQLEINRLTEESNMFNAQLEVDDCMEELRTYLGITDEVVIKTDITHQIPEIAINPEDALLKAVNNSSDIVSMERRKRESESNVAYAKSQAGLKADIYAQLGLTQTGDRFNRVYKDPQNHQYVELGIRIPILDWGRGKGRISVAKSNRDMVYTQVDQDRTNFELNVNKLVKQFNLQVSRVRVAVKTDYTASRRNDIARKLYILGRSTILDMNAAITEQNSARKNYINTLYNYWQLYYTIRSITLFDFEKNIQLTEDYNALIR
ncbi:outer membrane protein TolC [Dysgonomonas hofstadii]|uniref:Outer membrane protein TolC n=1 Tax=Dysgonomonas hofstadii TaxID=637886 RepID=A0A840CNB6_9BACT|nr:TolC family protein [Dysgonomonas hofstadii]MBB4035014.1 outer membrane protein TolC [Dysgonomonas hofstadii]